MARDFDYDDRSTSHTTPTPRTPLPLSLLLRVRARHALSATSAASLARRSAKSYGTLVGDIYHGWLDPDTPGWLCLRLFVMCVLGALGIWAGVRIQQR